MKYLGATMAALLGTCMQCAYSAQPFHPSWYVGGMYSRLSFQIPLLTSTTRVAFLSQAGWRFTEHFAVEARAGSGLTEGSFLGAADVSVGSVYGVYLRGSLPLADKFNAYALLGQATAKLRARAFGFNFSESSSGLSYAIGGEYGFGRSGHYWLGAEVGRLASATPQVDALSVGFRYVF